MSFMKGNVNIVLLTLVIVSMAGLVVMTVIYENRFTKLSDDYSTKMEELNDTMDTLNLQMTRYNETRYELELRSDREEELGSKYTTIKGEKEQLSTDLDQTTADLGEMKDNYIKAKNDLIHTQNELITAQTSLDTANSKITRYRNLIALLDSSIKKLRDHINPYINGDEDDACYNFANTLDEDLEDSEDSVGSLKSV